MLQPAEAASVRHLEDAKEAALAKQDITFEQVAKGVNQHQHTHAQTEAERALHEQIAECCGQSKEKQNQKRGRVELKNSRDPLWHPTWQDIVDTAQQPIQSAMHGLEGQSEMKSAGEYTE